MYFGQAGGPTSSYIWENGLFLFFFLYNLSFVLALMQLTPRPPGSGELAPVRNQAQVREGRIARGGEVPGQWLAPSKYR